MQLALQYKENKDYSIIQQKCYVFRLSVFIGIVSLLSQYKHNTIIVLVLVHIGLPHTCTELKLMQ